jgi:ATP-binding cassette subfamily C protein
MLRMLWAMFTHRERIQIFFLMIATMVGATLEVVGVGLVLPLISFLINPSGINDFPRVLEAFARFGVRSSREILVVACLVVIAVFIVKNVYLMMLLLFQYRLIFNKQASLSSQLLALYMRSPWTFHLQRNTAELLRNINHEVSLLFGNVLNPLTVLATEVLVTVAIMALLIVIEPVAAGAALVYLGAASLGFYRLIQRKSDVLGRQQQESRLGMLKWINQALGGIKETKVLGREGFFVRAYAEQAEAYVRTHRFLWLIGQLPRLCLETLIVSGMLLVSAIMVMRSSGSAMVLPTLSLFGAAAFRLMPSINRILGTFANIRHHRSTVKVLHDELKLMGTDEAAIQAAPHPPAQKLPFAQEIELRDVCYRYPQTHVETLSRLNMSIPKGASVALTGPSGAGKTTTVDIILGLLKPTHGAVLVDGRDIAEHLDAWQQQIGYVPQTIYLTDDSIRRNVAFGIADDQIREARVWKALRYAQLDDFVRGLPAGLDTEVGEHGVRLSGGQRQRIGIARALYHDPDVLVLDEATSSLDIDTEREFTKAIEGLSGQKTLIIIAHRLSTVEKCDLKYHIKAGKMELARERSPRAAQDIFMHEAFEQPAEV